MPQTAKVRLLPRLAPSSVVVVVVVVVVVRVVVADADDADDADDAAADGDAAEVSPMPSHMG